MSLNNGLQLRQFNPRFCTSSDKEDHRLERIHPASRSDVVGHEPSAATSSPAQAEPSISNASKGKARGDNSLSTRRVDLRGERLHIRRSSLRSSIVSSRASTASNPNSISKDLPRRESAVSSGSRHSIVSVKDASRRPVHLRKLVLCCKFCKKSYLSWGRNMGFRPRSRSWRIPSGTQDHSRRRINCCKT